jgi:hypothetical protein
LFHHDLIHILVEFHLVSTGDTWQGFLVRNEFLPLQIDPIIDLTQGVEDPFSPKASPNSLMIFELRFKFKMTLLFHPMPKQEVFPMARLAPKRHGFVPKKPLEVILSHLRNHSLNVDDQSQSTRPVVNEKHKDGGKQSRHLQEVCEVDFKNKRNGASYLE